MRVPGSKTTREPEGNGISPGCGQVPTFPDLQVHQTDGITWTCGFDIYRDCQRLRKNCTGLAILEQKQGNEKPPQRSPSLYQNPTDTSPSIRNFPRSLQRRVPTRVTQQTLPAVAAKAFLFRSSSELGDKVQSASVGREKQHPNFLSHTTFCQNPQSKLSVILV